jgi:RNA polymerase sigma-70 factor (ECF subfamily)
MKIPSKDLEFNKIAIPHIPMMQNYALRLLGHKEDAKDLVQETYLKAYRFWDKFEQGTNIKGWLYRLMKNTFINSYRKKIKEPYKIEYNEEYMYARKNQNKLSYTQEQDGSSSISGQKSYTLSEHLEDDVLVAIESLPLTYKNIIILSDIDEFSYQEIADRVKCPIGTVRSRLHRGRKILRNNLFHYAEDHGYNSDKL